MSADLEVVAAVEEEEGCPFCQSALDDSINDSIKIYKEYLCGTMEVQGEVFRGDDCYEARIKELEAECAADKCEITCLTCGNKFSVLNGDEEVNWKCPVCMLQARIKEFEALLLKTLDSGWGCTTDLREFRVEVRKALKVAK